MASKEPGGAGRLNQLVGPALTAFIGLRGHTPETCTAMEVPNTDPIDSHTRGNATDSRIQTLLQINYIPPFSILLKMSTKIEQITIRTPWSNRVDLA